MQSLKRACGYGFLVWLLTLLVSMVVFPLKKSTPALFDSIMPVVLSLFAVIFVTRYFRSGPKGPLSEGVWLGAIWLAMNLLLDLPLFSHGPMKMTLADYMADIGLTYLILPIITVGVGIQAARRTERHAS
jgi:uncharacterized membrane protein YpjA